MLVFTPVIIFTEQELSVLGSWREKEISSMLMELILKNLRTTDWTIMAQLKVSQVQRFVKYYGSTFIAVFLICTDHRAQHIFSERLHESIKERLASIPDHGKLVVSPPGWKSIGKIPETLHI
ncbi:unnamed protein product, partial [Pocillopora meandrina]